MTTSGAFERESIRLRAQVNLLGGRVYDSVPDDQELQRGASGVVKPYAVIHYGTIYRLPNGRSLTGEEDQPHVMPFTIECYAGNIEAARASAGAVRDLYVGWSPSPAADMIDAPGGSSYRDRDAAGVPTLFIEAVALETTINMGLTDGLIPTPGGGADEDAINALIAAQIASQFLASQRFDFPTPITPWIFTHGFTRTPLVAPYAYDGTRLQSDVDVDGQSVRVDWAVPTAGFVVLT